MGTPIPSPTGWPILGNVSDVDPENPLASHLHLADIYGPAYKLNLLGRQSIIVTTQELLNEICDEKRFQKKPSAPLIQLRNGLGDALFTAFSFEENWGLAHRILMPAFGPLSIREMFDEMHDIAGQLVGKFARYGPTHKIDVTGDFTRLTLDSIALCAMDTRFNSFYREDLHPFIEAMQFFLKESGARAQRSDFVSNTLYRAATKRYNDSIQLMQSVAKSVIDERRRHPTDKKDLVNAFLFGKDPKTGKLLSDTNVVQNMITFLIAGHETTSGLLSFFFVLLLKTPSAYNAAQKEVDEVVGKGPVTYEHMSKLPYITACLRETLRMYPTAPLFTVKPLSDDPNDYPVFIGKERYEIPYGTTLSALLPRIQYDVLVWGEDADVFKPERMLDDNFNKLPPNSWKPFGNGVRGCIGRPFAWQEALLTVCLLLQNFNFRPDNPSYQMQFQQTLTIKPHDYFMYATLRDGIDAINLERRLYGSEGSKKVSAKDKKVEDIASARAPKKPMSILFGSNTGTCESLAQTLSSLASNRGFNATVKPMDAAVEDVAKDEPLIMITASYEGQPTDNAAHFIEWLQNLTGAHLAGTKFAVFGCGHRDWQATFQKIPTLTDKLFEERGAKRLAQRGYADAANGDIFNDFDKWTDHELWPAISKEYGSEGMNAPEDNELDIEIKPHTRSSNLRQDVSEAIVEDVKVLTAPGESEKRHIELRLPSEMTYRAGDYLAVLPINHATIVKRVMKRFGLAWDSKFIVKEGQNTLLPAGQEMSVFAALSAYLEFNQPATVKNVAAIAKSIPDEATRDRLLTLSDVDFTQQITAKRVSPLDLLEAHPTAALTFGAYLAMLPPMRVRQYSISSSPLASPTTCTLTYSVLDQASTASNNKRHIGIASHFLSELEKGDRVRVTVRQSHQQAFRLPLDVGNVPVLMICAGTGLAPFRGFVQERACQIAAGRQLAPALLFIGCRHPGRDRLYAEEIDKWVKAGALQVRYAFSQASEASEGCKYVQDRLWHDRKEAKELWEKGARIFVCGSGAVGEGVREVVMKVWEEAKEGRTREEAEEWFKGVKGERFASDVFA